MNKEKLAPFAVNACQYTDDTGRITGIMQQTDRRPLRIAALGGSATYGYTAVNSVIPYPELLCDLLPVPAELRNFAVSGTDSYLGLLLTARDMQQYAPDLVIVEYAVNQNTSSEMVSAYEGLIYRLLTLPTSPAVIPVMCVHHSGFNSENCLSHIARYYGLPVISVKNGLKTYSWDEYSDDEIHPNQNGQAMIAYAIDHLIRNAHENPKYALPDSPCLSRDASAMCLFDLHSGSGGFFTPIHFLTAFGASDAVVLQSGSETYALTVTGDTVVVYFRQSCFTDTADAILTIDDCDVIRLQASCLSGWGNPAAVRIIPSIKQSTHVLRFQKDNQNGRFILWAVASF